MKTKILITGSSGFIGFHLANTASKQGWEITSISTKKPSSTRKVKKVKYLLKDQGMTINGVKKLLISGKSNELDEISNKSISADNLRNKISNISKIIKNLKNLK